MVSVDQVPTVWLVETRLEALFGAVVSTMKGPAEIAGPQLPAVSTAQTCRYQEPSAREVLVADVEAQPAAGRG